MTTFLRISQVACVASLFGLVACGGTFRVVKKTQDGGLVALAGSRDDAHTKAEQYMASQCSGGYDIVEEGEAVIGETSSGQANRTFFGGVATNTSTTQKTEWRITYRCKGAAAPAGTPANAAPQQTGALRTVTIRF